MPESLRARSALGLSMAGAVGSGCWIAWITIIYSADVSLPTGINALQTTADAFILSTFSLGVALIVLSCAPRWTARHGLGGRSLAVVSLIGAGATLGVLNGPLLPPALFVLCAVATGLATSLIALRAALVLSEVETKAMIVAMGSALMLGVLIYAFDMMLVLCGLPILAAALLVLLLPLAAAALSMPADLGGSENPDAFTRGASRGRMPAEVVRLTVFIVMLLFLLSLTRGYYPNLMEPGQFAASRSLVGLGLLAVGAAMAALAAVSPRNAAFGTLFYGLLVGSVLVVLVLALLNVDATVMGDVSSVLYGMTMLCLWALLCRVSFRSGRSAVQVVGVGFGAACLGTTAGVGAGSALYTAGVSTAVLAFVMAAAVILCVASSLFLLRIDDVKALMQPSEEELEEEWPPVPATVSSRLPGSSVRSAQEGETAADRAPAETVAALDGYQASLRRLCAVMAVDYGLSTREVDVLELLVVGKDAKAIADELFISFNTVRSHIRRIYVKLDVHSRQELLDLVKEAPQG